MQNNTFRLLFLGDMVGKDSLEAFHKYGLDWREELGLDMIIVNGENLANGSGITVKIANELWRSGVDVVTTGDHIWKQRDFIKRIDEFPFIIRPANYPPGAPGKGYIIWAAAKGVRVAVLNLLGRVFMQPVDCPFRKADEVLSELDGKADIVVVDFHAEATSEKIAMGYYLDGRVAAVLGTHTHVPTADAKLLPKGTAYITDVGMVGPQYSVLGRVVDNVVRKYVAGIPQRFPVAEPPIEFNGVVIEIDLDSKKVKSIEQWKRLVYLN